MFRSLAIPPNRPPPPPDPLLNPGTLSCNKHVLTLGTRIKSSLAAAGITGYGFGTPAVSDGISMGTFGMSYSLQSRDLIADSVETVGGGHWLDGMVTIPVRSGRVALLLLLRARTAAGWCRRTDSLVPLSGQACDKNMWVLLSPEPGLEGP